MVVRVEVEEGNANPFSTTDNGHRDDGLDADTLDIFHREVFILVGVIYRHNGVGFKRFYTMGDFVISIADGTNKFLIHAIARNALPHVHTRLILREGRIVCTQGNA